MRGRGFFGFFFGVGRGNQDVDLYVREGGG